MQLGDRRWSHTARNGEWMMDGKGWETDDKQIIMGMDESVTNVREDWKWMPKVRCEFFNFMSRLQLAVRTDNIGCV